MADFLFCFKTSHLKLYYNFKETLQEAAFGDPFKKIQLGVTIDQQQQQQSGQLPVLFFKKNHLL